MKLPLRFGVAGCGYIFRTMYAPLFAAWPQRVQLAAIADPFAGAREKVAAQFPEAALFASVEEMLAAGGLDAVMVLTKEHLNAPTATLALRAGLPVFLEKPPAISVAELDELIDAEASAAGTVYTAFNRRHTPLFNDWKGAPELRGVRGWLHRIGREVPSFPYTAIHLLDAAAHFAGTDYGPEVQVDFAEREGVAEWNITGAMTNGARLALQIIPNGRTQCEWLGLESAREVATFHFPNPTADDHPHGLLRRDSLEGGVIDELAGEPMTAPEAMGFAACLSDFVGHAARADWTGCTHRLERCRGLITILEAMQRTQAQA